MSKKTDWWDEHIIVVSTTGNKKLEDKLNKELKKKVLKNLTDKPKQENKMKTAIINVNLEYNFSDNMSEQEIKDELANVELPSEYVCDSYEFVKIMEIGE